MVEIGGIVTLDDSKEYVVINKINLHNVNYVFLITTSKPLEILIVTEKIVNGEIVLDEIKDNDELEYILSQFSSQMEREEK